jgi:hypothetical protein
VIASYILFLRAKAQAQDRTDRGIASRSVAAQSNAIAVKHTAPVLAAALRAGLTLRVEVTPPAIVTPGRSLGGELAIGIGVAVALILAAIFGLVWLAHHRSRSRVRSRLKEIRSKATDLMDRIDALKERLKLLPGTDPDFQAPLSGQTLELYNGVQGSLGRLWDRWLQVMDTLDRAQKLAGSPSSPFHRKTLSEAETLLEQKGVFEEIDKQAQAIVTDMDRLNQAHEAARGELKAIASSKPKLDGQLAAVR